MKASKRIVVVSVGVLVIAVGLIVMPVPGPGGVPVVLLGLTILATE